MIVILEGGIESLYLGELWCYVVKAVRGASNGRRSDANRYRQADELWSGVPPHRRDSRAVRTIHTGARLTWQRENRASDSEPTHLVMNVAYGDERIGPLCYFRKGDG